MLYNDFKSENHRSFLFLSSPGKKYLNTCLIKYQLIPCFQQFMLPGILLKVHVNSFVFNSNSMEINIIIFLTLLAYSFLVSQSFLYIIALHNVQTNMEAVSYIELRKLLDRNFRKKYSIVVYSSLISTTLLTFLCSAEPTGILFISAAIALAALIIDTLLTVKGNMPINKIINTWSKDNYPADWKLYRKKWLSVFGKRQVAVIIGFLSLLLGAVFG